MKKTILSVIVSCIITGLIIFSIGKSTEKKRITALLLTEKNEVANNLAALDYNTDPALSENGYTLWYSENRYLEGQSYQISKIATKIQND